MFSTAWAPVMSMDSRGPRSVVSDDDSAARLTAFAEILNALATLASIHSDAGSGAITLGDRPSIPARRRMSAYICNASVDDERRYAVTMPR
ncbi:Uncharacterised protein [Mycobacteroides abscessus subsp. abscessus]|nr:Uncharacterised protein [Mycobacteroides abscessus subsp. abscessus]SKV38104.1 Uncharacterised protein [Mycobacteroides abscessus subsp. abscessus]